MFLLIKNIIGCYLNMINMSYVIFVEQKTDVFFYSIIYVEGDLDGNF